MIHLPPAAAQSINSSLRANDSVAPVGYWCDGVTYTQFAPLRSARRRSVRMPCASTAMGATQACAASNAFLAPK